MGLAVVARIISVRSRARSFPQRDHRARKGILRVIATTKLSGILAPHAPPDKSVRRDIQQGKAFFECL